MLKRLVLFDIDGTLIWSAGAGRSAIAQALVAEMGMTGPIEDYHFDGKTDPQIVMELMLAAGHPDAQSETHVQAVCRRYLDVLTHELQTRKGSVRAYPGVEDLLATLERRGDVLVGLLTGNIADGAAQKLTAAGIEMSRFRIGAYGSDSADRADLPPIAAARAAPLMGRIPEGEDIIIIGDTPADMACGDGVRARAIGVATGRHSVVELLAAGAHVAFDSLLDTASVVDAIYS